MLEFLLSIVLFIILKLLSFVWWVITWSWPVIIMLSFMGGLFWRMQYLPGNWKKMEKPQKEKYRLTPQKPAFFINQFGHRVKIDPDPEMEKSVRSYLRDHNIAQKDL